MDELNFIIDSTEELMSKAIAHLETEFKNIRAGKASPAMLMGVKVDYYGTMTPLNQVANINTPDARTLIVQPWERKLISEIEKAILIANLGFNPMNNGENIIINVPVLTEERRKDLSKQAKAAAEETKVGIRNDRRNAMNEIKKIDASEDMKKNTEVDIQELTDKYIKIVDEHYAIKEKEIMTV
ncbi:MAG: ribosome recycling factor [Flavobacteriaceae bacterium]|nr:ribosome recycling factor [Flavobacteriaceae bacterium]